jgi:hypothetical protein
MKFIFADSLDFVDPEYDFVEDANAAKRRWHEDDEFPHEHLDAAPYDGILVSRAIVGGVRKGGKYTPAQAMRLSREGARAFLRYPSSSYPQSIIMGDCGAFSYRDAKKPPYTVDDTLEFYEDGGFTHGCSVDHLIFDFTRAVKPPSADVRDRYEVTLENARAFIKGSKRLRRFTPLGVIQGWSPASMAEAAKKLSKMGYDYLAVGGMVPLKIAQIAEALESIRAATPSKVKLHILGFGKIEDIQVLHRYGVASFDTTSPLTRAFKDAKKNYYSLLPHGELEYFTAVRIPQATVNDRLTKTAKKGGVDQEHLVRMETAALKAVRAFAAGRCTAPDAVDEVLAYDRYALWNSRLTGERNARHIKQIRETYIHTLSARPWERCACRVCRETGVEAVIFRSSNRNKRRGMHNLHVFYTSLRTRFGQSL